MARRDVSDALPGVAVAIALVPPLAVVGLMIQAGELDDAVGALLLFVTNLVATLLVGAVVFVFTGVVPIGQILHNRRWIRTTLTLVGSLALIVVATLGVISDRITAEAFLRGEAEAAIEAWIGDGELSVFDLAVGTSEVVMTVVGPDRPPAVDDLGPQMEAALDRGVDVVVNWVPQEAFSYTVDDG